MIWPDLEKGARPFYEALTKVEFSPAIYKRLLDFYEAKLEASRDQLGSLDSSQDEILHHVACQVCGIV